MDLLGQLHLSVVTDFRSAQEREGAEDRLPQQSPPIVYRTVAVNNPVLDVAELGRRVYAGEIKCRTAGATGSRAYITDPALRAAWGNWLRSLSQPGAAAAVPLQAGKDRTGFAAAIALLAVGVPRETVMEDFLLNNGFLASRIEQGVARIQANTTAYLDPDVLARSSVSVHPAWRVRLQRWKTGMVRSRAIFAMDWVLTKQLAPGLSGCCWSRLVGAGYARRIHRR